MGPTGSGRPFKHKHTLILVVAHVLDLSRFSHYENSYPQGYAHCKIHARITSEYPYGDALCHVLPNPVSIVTIPVTFTLA
jgi:hypothetical protein